MLSSCWKRGHTKDSCYDLVGFPSNYQGSRNCGNPYKQETHNDALASLNVSGQQCDSSTKQKMLSLKDYERIIENLKKEIKTLSLTNTKSVGTGTVKDSEESSSLIPTTLSSTHELRACWILDSRATCRVVSNLFYLDHYQKYVGSPLHIEIPNSARLPVTHVGVVDYSMMLY